MSVDVVVIGAGLAGLNCADHLTKAGLSVRLLEASDEVGGRVRTDMVDGFQIDRGFQVYLTAYPEGRAALDYQRLDLQQFSPGALVRWNGKFHRLSDPWRDPSHGLSTLGSPLLTIGDKARVALWQLEARRRETAGRSEGQPPTTLRMLRSRGFSERAIDRFFRPFLGGVLLDRDLNADASHSEFLFRMFATGSAAIPAAGMGAIPKAIASRLPDQSVRLGCPVEAIEPGGVSLANGERLAARAIVVATDAANAAKLRGEACATRFHGVTTLSYACPSPPVKDPILVLNGDGPESGPINDLSVLSNVASGYAPPGQALVSATVLGVHEDEEAVARQALAQLRDWFGKAVDGWRLLKTHQIAHALPEVAPSAKVAGSTASADGVFQCGDWLHGASINGALASGRETAEAVIKQLKA